METTFKSYFHPEMNPFLAKLEKVLQKLPDNPKPDCKGFYLSYCDFKRGTLIAEPIGIIPAEKKFKYMYFSSKKSSQTLYLGERRSKNFENNEQEQFPGGFVVGLENPTFSVGVSGHDSMVDEAIALFWGIVKEFNSSCFPVVRDRDFWDQAFGIALAYRDQFAPDNKWIEIIGRMISEEK